MLGHWSVKSKLGIALVLTSSSCLLVVWLIRVATYDHAAQLRAEAAQIALKVAPAELPDEDNAAFAYEQALRAVGNVSSWPQRYQEAWSNWIGEVADPFDSKDLELATFLTAKAGAIERLRAAGRKPGYRVHRDFAHLGDLDVSDETMRLRAASELLALNARFQAANGNPTAALEDCRTLFAIAEHVADDPFFNSLLISIAINALGAATLESVLEEGAASTKDQTNVIRNAGFSYIPKFLRTLPMEEARGLVVFAEFAEGRLPIRLSSPPLTKEASIQFYRVFQLPVDLKSFRVWTKRFQQLAKDPPFQNRSEIAAAKAAVEDNAGFLSRNFLLAIPTMQFAVARGDARRRLVRLALAAYRFQLLHDRLPNELGELTPDFIDAIPLDPFDGKPLRMKKTETGVLFYCIDVDFKDEGGARYQQETKSGDIRFSVRAR